MRLLLSVVSLSALALASGAFAQTNKQSAAGQTTVPQDLEHQHPKLADKRKAIQTMPIQCRLP